MWSKSYARKSRILGDRDDIDVVAHQFAACDRMAAEDGVTLRPEDRIAEIGSGESLAARPRFLGILGDLERSPPPGGGRLYVTEVARLTRAEMSEAGLILRRLREAGILIRIPGRCFDLTNADDEMYFGWMCLGARHEIQRFRSRVAVKMQKLLDDGEIRVGAAPFGYLRDRNARRLQADPERFPVLVACCREVLLESVARVARRHNLSPNTLYSVLKNPLICGWPAIHYAPTAPGQKEQRLPVERIRWCGRQNDTYPHACTRSEWEQIQRVLHARARTRCRTGAQDCWCRDVVAFEGMEGQPYLGGTSRGTGAQRVVPIYQLRQAGRRVAWIERERVHRAVAEKLLELFASPGSVEAMVDSFLLALDHERQASQGNSLPLALADVERRYQEAVDAEFDAGEPLRSALSVRRLRLESELADLRQQQAREGRRSGEDEQLRRALARLPGLARWFPEFWAQADEGQRREVVGLAIERVVVRVERRPEGEPGAGQIRSREVVRIVPQPWFRE